MSEKEKKKARRASSSSPKKAKGEGKGEDAPRSKGETPAAEAEASGLLHSNRDAAFRSLAKRMFYDSLKGLVPSSPPLFSVAACTAPLDLALI